MEDEQIVQLYWERSDEAIRQTQRKYDGYCMGIACGILPDREDARECVSDTYLAAWNSIPPHRPAMLSTFLGKLTRRICIDRWRSLAADKRGGGAVAVALEELEACVPSGSDPAKEVETKELARAISDFLRTLPYVQRKIFLMRYFEMADTRWIGKELQIGEGKVRTVLHRTRKKLREYLREEAYL